MQCVGRGCSPLTYAVFRDPRCSQVLSKNARAGRVLGECCRKQGGRKTSPRSGACSRQRHLEVGVGETTRGLRGCRDSGCGPCPAPVSHARTSVRRFGHWTRTGRGHPSKGGRNARWTHRLRLDVLRARYTLARSWRCAGAVASERRRGDRGLRPWLGRREPQKSREPEGPGCPVGCVPG